MRGLQGMTVAELRETLADFPDEAIVIAASDYGDRSHTTQVLPIQAARGVSRDQVSDSAYSRSGWKLKTDEENDVDNGDVAFVVIGSKSDLWD